MSLKSIMMDESYRILQQKVEERSNKKPNWYGFYFLTKLSIIKILWNLDSNLKMLD